jgi:putative oxidoreductase
MNQLRALEAPAALIGRLLLALIFVDEGWLKVTNYAGTQGYMEANGVPGALLPLVILTELGCGILVAIGLLTRLAAIGLMGFCLLTALLFHMASDMENVVNFYKNLALAGGFLTLAAHGAGAWSLDAWWMGRRPRDR